MDRSSWWKAILDSPRSLDAPSKSGVRIDRESIKLGTITAILNLLDRRLVVGSCALRLASSLHSANHLGGVTNNRRACSPLFCRISPIRLAMFAFAPRIVPGRILRSASQCYSWPIADTSTFFSAEFVNTPHPSHWRSSQPYARSFSII